MKNIAIIPARSGSKGLKDKNIKELNGKPLMAYTIDAAIKSGCFETVFVSTDSEKYAAIAKSFGAEVPFLRRKMTSSDTASSWDVVDEVLKNYELIDNKYDTFMLLQPTSPLRTSEDIKNAYNELLNKNAKAIVSVCEIDHSPRFCNILPEDKSLKSFIRKDSFDKRRQDLQTYYRFNGAIYLAYVDYFRIDHNIYREGCFAYVMSKKTSVDIDDEYDFLIAEAIISKSK